jgi:uncharacterized protein YciI
MAEGVVASAGAIREAEEMVYVILCRYRPGGAEARFAIRARHLEYMIAALPRTVAGGGLLDEGGSAVGMLVMIDVADREPAERFVAAEPYNAAGLFESVQITPIRLMTPEPELDFLVAELHRQWLDDRAKKASRSLVT